jgi:hypothetical protein
MYASLMKTVLTSKIHRTYIYQSLLALIASLFFLGSASAQSYAGANSSSELIQINVRSNGMSEVVWFPAHLGGKVSIREIWQASIEINGFKFIPPSNSLLIKSGSITYLKASSSSGLIHCTAGCNAGMPNLLGVSRL